MEKHKYVVMMDAYNGNSKDQFVISKENETLAGLDADIAANPTHDGIPFYLSKAEWSMTWIRSVQLRNILDDQMNKKGSECLLVHK
jgi:hypothetical protein